ncbi:hypothetical protein ES703_71748 [subsurface metagenome]
MIKKAVLFLVCLSLLSIPGCKKKLPTQPDIPIVKPTIESFYAYPTEICLGDSSTLSWSTSNATQVFINMVTGDLPVAGTLDVYPEETTTYVLTAKNDAGIKLSSCTVSIAKWAIIELTTNPALPTFYYDWLQDKCFANFDVVINESGGVGGDIYSILIDGKIDQWTPCVYDQEIGGGRFYANGSLSRSCALVLPCKPYIVTINISGIDNNYYTIDKAIFFTIAWTQNTGTMSLVKIVEGVNHHKLIK